MGIMGKGRDKRIRKAIRSEKIGIIAVIKIFEGVLNLKTN